MRSRNPGCTIYKAVKSINYRGASLHKYICIVNKGSMWTKVGDMAGSPLTIDIRINR